MKTLEMIKRFSLLPQGLRYKLLIAFSLMSIIPLLVIGYLVNNFLLLEETMPLAQVSVIILFCIIIAWTGLFLAKTIVERVIDVALEARIITDGNFDRRIETQENDEIGQIGEAINFLTRKIKDNIVDLKDYQGKMKEINVEIQKKVSVLSNLLQIGELISSSVNIESILELVLGKLSNLYEGGFAALYFAKSHEEELTLRASEDLENEELLKARIKEGRGLLGKALLKRRHAVVDASSKFSSEVKAFKSEYKCDNIVAFPLRAAKKAKAMLVMGNSVKNFTYTSDDIDMIKVFAEQISIAIENDALMKKAETLEIKDSISGLFNRSYITSRLKEEIQRSIVSQRPCSFIIANIDGFKQYESKNGRPQAEVAIRKIAKLLGDFSGPIGKVGSIEDGSFALVMPETNKKSSLTIAEKIRKGVEKLTLSEKKNADKLTVSCGVSENPLDGADPDEIFEKATSAVSRAKKEGKNKVIGAGV